MAARNNGSCAQSADAAKLLWQRILAEKLTASQVAEEVQRIRPPRVGPATLRRQQLWQTVVRTASRLSAEHKRLVIEALQKLLKPPAARGSVRGRNRDAALYRRTPVTLAPRRHRHPRRRALSRQAIRPRALRSPDARPPQSPPVGPAGPGNPLAPPLPPAGSADTAAAGGASWRAGGRGPPRPPAALRLAAARRALPDRRPASRPRRGNALRPDALGDRPLPDVRPRDQVRAGLAVGRRRCAAGQRAVSSRRLLGPRAGLPAGGRHRPLRPLVGRRPVLSPLSGFPERSGLAGNLETAAGRLPAARIFRSAKRGCCSRIAAACGSSRRRWPSPPETATRTAVQALATPRRKAAKPQRERSGTCRSCSRPFCPRGSNTSAAATRARRSCNGGSIGASRR